MIHHAVYFWLKPELSSTERNSFAAALKKLCSLKSVEQGLIGSPAATTKRPQVEDTYDFGLVVYFKDLAAHNTYQDDPDHRGFIANNSKYWNRVQIFDIESAS